MRLKVLGKRGFCVVKGQLQLENRTRDEWEVTSISQSSGRAKICILPDALCKVSDKSL